MLLYISHKNWIWEIFGFLRQNWNLIIFEFLRQNWNLSLFEFFRPNWNLIIFEFSSQNETFFQAIFVTQPKNSTHDLFFKNWHAYKTGFVNYRVTSNNLDFVLYRICFRWRLIFPRKNSPNKSRWNGSMVNFVLSGSTQKDHAFVYLSGWSTGSRFAWIDWPVI